MALLKEKAFELLGEAWHSGRLAHAYLFSAPPGAGKEWLSTQLASFILQTSLEQVPSHPDYHSVAPESKSRRIIIEQMRSLEQNLQMKPLAGRTKVAVIYDADRLQPQAANAFLKTLEEPPSGCYLFLLTVLPQAVLETIASRCIAVSLRLPPSSKLSSASQEIADVLTHSLRGKPDIIAAMQFTRCFQKTLTDIREHITKELDHELKRELKQYREAVSSKWQEERENQIKAQVEAAIIEQRENLLQAAEEVLAAALRQHHLPHQPCSEEIRQIASTNDPSMLLRRLAALERTRHLLARGVQEGLALESGFLEMIVMS